MAALIMHDDAPHALALLRQSRQRPCSNRALPEKEKAKAYADAKAQDGKVVRFLCVTTFPVLTSPLLRALCCLTAGAAEFLLLIQCREHGLRRKTKGPRPPRANPRKAGPSTLG
jgi:hypothetical protein